MTREDAVRALVDVGGEIAAELRASGHPTLWAVKYKGQHLSTHLTRGAALRWVENSRLSGHISVVLHDATVNNPELDRALLALASFAKEDLPCNC